MIIFLYGPDSFRSREKLKSLKSRFIREVDKSGFNLIEIEAEKISLDDFNRAVASRSFLSRKRMVIVRGVLKQNKNFQNEILGLLKQGKYREEGRENVIVFLDDEVDKRGALFKYLDGSKFKEEFETLNESQLVNWIIKRVADKGGKIGRPEAELLASKSDGNLWALAGEIDKIIAAKKRGLIRRDDIEESSLAKIDENIFNLTDAIADKNKIKALKLINDQLRAGVNEIYLLTMIVRQFRILVLVKNELARGVGNYKQMAENLGLHSFVVQKAIPQAAKYSLDELKKIYAKLLETDVELKRGGEGKVLLEMFIMEI